MLTVFKHLFRFQYIVIVIAVTIGIYYTQIIVKLRSSFDNRSVVKFYERKPNFIFTKQTLGKFSGKTEDEPIYLSILGSVYDVTKGRKHYGPGCSYGYFAGRDASKSFITGEFEQFNKHSDDVLSLSPEEILSLYEWKEFYEKEYIFKGLLVGRFYDANGRKTKYHLAVDQVAAQARLDRINKNLLNEIYPPCNIEWTEQKGTRVWCTNQSGGKKRSYVGVPRKLYDASENTYRCVCLAESELENENIKEYENCDPHSTACFYKIP